MSDQLTDRRNEWMERVLGLRIARPQAVRSTVELSKRFSALAAKARDPGAPAGLLDDLRTGVAVLKSGDVARATALLEDIEAKLERGGRPAEAARPAAAETAQGTADEPAAVPLPTPQAMADAVKPRLKLRAAESAIGLAIGNLEVACRAMLRTPAFADDPQAEDDAVQAAIDAIGERVPDFAPVSAAVQDALDRLSGAPASQQATLAAPALAAIRSYRQAIDAEPLLREMETTAAGSYPIHAAMGKALDELAAALNG